MKKLKVIMLGPSLKEQGGMGSVATLILKATLSEVEVQHICTWDGVKSQRSKLHMLLVFIKALMILLRKLVSDRADIVHLHIAERGSVWRKSILALLALAFRKPTIIHAHGSEFHLFYERLPLFLKDAISWVFQKCSYFIVLSDSWKDYYIKNCYLSPEKVIVLPNPVELPIQVPDRHKSEPLNFVFLGKINQRKGVFDLLSAFAKLDSETRKKVILTIAGTGELERAIDLAEHLQIDKQVHFIGWIDAAKRDYLLSQADVFLLPSYNEGLPMALLEAMSWGLPAIATPVGGIGEVVTHNQTGLLVEPGNVNELAEAMQSLLDSETLRIRLGLAARMRVASLDIKHYSASLNNLYASVIKQQQGWRKLIVS
jgi:glycosyltransferase involved in cell wall biosynthesis